MLPARSCSTDLEGRSLTVVVGRARAADDMNIRTAEDDTWRSHAVLHRIIDADVRIQRQDVAGIGQLFLQPGHDGPERCDLGVECS